MAHNESVGVAEAVEFLGTDGAVGPDIDVVLVG